MGLLTDFAFADAPRPPVSIRLDEREFRRVLPVALSIGLAPSMLIARAALGGVAGLGLWVVTRSITAAVLVGLGLPLALILVQALRTAVAFRQVSVEGTVRTSGYDTDGMFILQRPDSVRRLPRAWARTVETRGDYRLVHPRRPRERVLVVKTELLMVEDVVFLTRVGEKPRLTNHVVVTDRLRRDVWRGTLRSMQTPAFVSSLAFALLLPTLMALMIPGTWPVLVFAVVLFALVLALSHYGTRLIWEPGSQVGAEIDGDDLVLDIPHFPPRVPLTKLREVRPFGRSVMIRWDLRRWVLPRDLVPDADLARLLDVVRSRRP